MEPVVKETALTIARRTEAKVDQILALVGQETEDGKGGFTGTGLMGRVRRLEDGNKRVWSKVGAMAAFGSGFAGAFGLIASVVAFLVRGMGLHFPGVK
jgi:hypothetical protein